MAMLATPAVKSAGKLSPDAIKAQMHLTGNQGAQLDRIVLAGRKIMFSPQSHKMMLDQLNGPGTMGSTTSGTGSSTISRIQCSLFSPPRDQPELSMARPPPYWA